MKTKEKFLSLEEMQEIGNTPPASTDREKLVFAHKKFAAYLAHRYFRAFRGTAGVTIEDFHQEAMIGLMIASRKYRAVGVKFTSYAGFWIKACVYRFHHRLNLQNRNVEYSDEVLKALLFEENDFCDLPYGELPLRVDGPEEDILDRMFYDRLRSYLMRNNASKELQVIIDYFGLEGAVPESGYSIGRKQGITRQAIALILNKSMRGLRNDPEFKTICEGHLQ